MRFHNLSGYDSHLFVKELSKEGEGTDVTAIPENEQKYIMFSKTKFIKEGSFGNKLNRTVTLAFIDTMKHLQSSLETLVNNLPDEKFKNMRKQFNEEELKLFKRKGVYPYEYVDSFEQFREKEFPPFEAFGSTLNRGIVYEDKPTEDIEKEQISREDYEHGLNVFRKMKCQTFGDYSKLCCQTDTLLLADVFEAYRDLSLEIYGLDPNYYVTAPSLSIDAMLKMSGAEIELLTDENMYLFFEEGIRGGVSVISNRYGKANNKYMGELYDPKKEAAFIVYLDANGLYSYVMLCPLPYRNFRWMCAKRLKKLMEDPTQIKSFTLEVDLDIPETKEFHHYTKDYPLAPETKIVNGVPKLAPNLLHKRNYVVHHKALQCYLRLGAVLKKIHRGVSYEEKEFIKEYIETNQKKREKAKNKFEKDFFKLMNNSVFGKTMENVRARSGVKLVSGASDKGKKRLRKLIANPTFKSAKVFEDSSLVSVNMAKREVMLDKPIAVGQAILDISNVVMFNFHYDYVLKKWSGKAKLLATDTDSLMYEIRTSDFFQDINPDVKTHFDTSDYPKDHPSGILTGQNKKVLGLFKDELQGKIVKE